MSSTALVQTPSSSAPVARHETSRSASSAIGVIANGAQDASARSSRSLALPSTPFSGSKSLLQQHASRTSSPRASTPGQWEHPQMQEILRRQRTTMFDETNVAQLTRSIAGLLAVMFIPGWLTKWVLPMSASKLVPPELMWLSYLIQLILLANATAAIMPLLRKKDLIEDIPLTPKQRQLLDLPPMSRSATPQEQAAYVTPPRYSRNTTPNLTDSLLVNARSTPLSDRDSPLNSEIVAMPSLTKRRSSNGSSFTPSSTRRISDISLRRDSYGTPRSSPQAFNELEGIVPSMKGGRTSIGLNSKWLYDKSKDSPTSSAFQGPSWGTGSVFN